MNWNKLLTRQIRKTLGGTENIPEEIIPLLEMVDHTYKYYERDHQLIERSMAISSEELRQVHHKLEKRNQLLEEYAYVIAHDLKTPIRSIVSFNQLLLKRYSDDLNDEAKKLMNYAIDASFQMNKLLDGLLKFSVINKGEQQYEEIDLMKLLKGVKDFMRLEILSNEATIHIQTPLPKVRGVKPLIFQLFLNIITNSIKYKSEEAPVIDIRHCQKKGNQTVFSISDNGVGIAEEHHERVFLLFKRLGTNIPGTGIGLSLCQQIVHKHQGRIWIEPTVSKGTTFKFTLET